MTGSGAKRIVCLFGAGATHAELDKVSRLAQERDPGICLLHELENKGQNYRRIEVRPCTESGLL